LAVLALSGGSTSVTGFIVISDTITTGSTFAVGSACIWNSIRVGRSIITDLTKGNIDNTISAKKGAPRRASGVAIELSKITLFTRILHTITTGGHNTGHRSASISSSIGVLGSIITLFTNVQDTISTEGVLAGGSATRSLLVGVPDSKVTFFNWALDSITAFNLAVGVASITIHIVSIITSLTHEVISNSITTEGENTSGSASVG